MPPKGKGKPARKNRPGKPSAQGAGEEAKKPAAPPAAAAAVDEAPAVDIAALREMVEEDTTAAAAAAPSYARPAGGPAWVDDDDEGALSLPAAVRSAAVPSWAVSTLNAAREGKRGRDADNTGDELLDGVRSVLSRAEPVLHRGGDKRVLTAPKAEATIMQQQGGIKDVAWHPSGEVLLAGTARGIDVFHCAGTFTEKIATHAIERSRISTFAVTPRGESAVVLPQHANVPLEVNLRTGKVKPLHFMDTRSSAAFKVASRGKRADEFPLLLTFQPQRQQGAGRQFFAMPIGAQVALGSLSDATITQRLALPGTVEDAIFMGDNELAVAVANRVLVYDVRATGQFVRQFNDEGSLKVNRLAYHGGVLSVGSTSGTVNTYIGDATTPAKTFMNLTASVDLLVAGEGSLGPSMVMGASTQRNGFRFVNTSTMTVAASFPEVGMKHGFVQCLAFNPVHPLFTVGEGKRLVNYAC